MEFSPASVVADAAENLSGDPLLHMVHTKASTVCYLGRSSVALGNVQRLYLRDGATPACMTPDVALFASLALTSAHQLAPLCTGWSQGGLHDAGLRYRQGPQESAQVHEGARG